jgi:hypothetical protein
MSEIQYTPEGLPIVENLTCVEVEQQLFRDLKRIFNESKEGGNEKEPALRVLLETALEKISRENPNIIFGHMNGIPLNHIRDPEKVSREKLEYLEGFATAYELLRAQSIKNQGKEANQAACPKAPQEAMQPAYGGNNIFEG